MTIETAGMLAGAGAFTVVAGANDGGALVAVGRSVRGLNPVTCFALLVVSVVTAPLLVGTGVAQTLTSRLVDFGGSGRSEFLPAVLAVIAVVSVLGMLGLPTSITLALVGGITGAGLGAGAEVGWGVVGSVLGLAALAPLAGALMARLLVWASGWVPVPEGVPARVRWLHVVAFLLVCVAYGANDGQKMLAVVSVGYAVTVPEGATSPVVMSVVVVGFLAGAVLGYRRFARTVGHAIVPLAPEEAVTSELACASVVLASAALSSPVSMTQAVSGAMVGAGSATARPRVRWPMVTRIVAAWAITLPVSLVVGLATTVVIGLVSS